MRHLWTHRVSVSRLSRTVPQGAVLLASVPCLIELVPSKSQESVLGRIPSAKYIISWGTELLNDGDLITVTTGPMRAVGKVFVLRETADDTGINRVPYQKAVLEERK